MTRQQDKKDTAYIVAIVILVCIIAAIALYRNNSTESSDFPKVSTENSTESDTPPQVDNQADNEQFLEEVPEIDVQTKETSKETKDERLLALQRQLDRITKALLKAEKSVKEAQQKLNEIVIKAEADTTADVEPNTTSAIKNLLYWQNEVERLQYEQENVREKMR